MKFGSIIRYGAVICIGLVMLALFILPQGRKSDTFRVPQIPRSPEKQGQIQKNAQAVKNFPAKVKNHSPSAVSKSESKAASEVNAAPATVTEQKVRAEQQGSESGTHRMVERLAQVARDAGPRANIYENLKRITYYRKVLDELLQDPKQEPSTLFRIRYDLGNDLLYGGKTEEALEEFKKNYRMLSKTESHRTRMIAKLHDRMGVCHLRAGEQSNCIQHHSSESCIVPIRGSGIHSYTTGSRSAIREYLAALDIEPGNMIYRWVLNVAYMTLGEHPEKVPEKWLIPLSAFDSDYDIKHFSDVAFPLKLNVIGRSGSCIMEDFDGDGYLDIIASSSGLLDQLRYFRNNTDGTFTDDTESAGLLGLVGGLNICHADYNNDGFPDIYVMRGAWTLEPGRDPNSLLRNNGDGTFDDVTEQAGIFSLHPTLSAAWADFNNDGWVDLLVGNESGNQAEIHFLELFRNNEDGTFTECAREMGIKETGQTKGVAWGDYNNDGRPDLYLSFLNSTNILYRNDGTKFVNVTRKAGVPGPKASFPTWFWDYNNDGWLDLFVAGSPHIPEGDELMSAVAARYLGYSAHLKTIPFHLSNTLYRNNHDGTFTNVTREAKLDYPMLPMGANYGDLDNDGFLDFYIGTGDIDFSNLLPNRMFRNAGGKYFQDVTTSGGFGHVQKGHGIAFGDIDNDGDQDVYAVMGGAMEGDGFQNVLYLNPGHGNHWIALRLEGVRSNRAALGARIRVSVDTRQGQRDIYATVTSGGSFGSSSFQQEIGLGQATMIRFVEVHWPTTGEKQIFNGIGLDQRLKIREGEPTPVPVSLKKIDWSSLATQSRPSQHLQ